MAAGRRFCVFHRLQVCISLVLINLALAMSARAGGPNAATSGVGTPYNFEILSGNEYTSALSDRQIPILGNVAYSFGVIGGYGEYLFKFDITNPLQPMPLRHDEVSIGMPSGFIEKVRAVGGQLYAVTRVLVNDEKDWWHDILYLINQPSQVNDGIDPFDLEEWTEAQGRVMESSEDHLFIHYSRELDFSTFDPTYSDPRMKLRWKATIDLGDGGDIRHIRSAGNKLLICNGYKGVLLYDITTQSQPILRSIIPPFDEIYDIAVKGNLLYLTDQFAPGTQDNFSIYDVSDLARPRKLGSCKLPDGYARDLDLGGGMAYVTTQWNKHFYAIDVSDPAAPQVRARYDYDSGPYDYSNHHYYKGYVFTSYAKILRYKPQGAVGVSNLNRPNYRVDYYRPGNSVYVNLENEFAAAGSPPALKEQTYILPHSADLNSTASGFLSFDIDQPATVYVAYDARATRLPQWLANWSKSGWTLGVTNTAVPRRTLYSRKFPAGRVSLGGNLDQGMASGSVMYSVFVVPGKTGVGAWDEYR